MNIKQTLTYNLPNFRYEFEDMGKTIDLIIYATEHWQASGF